MFKRWLSPPKKSYLLIGPRRSGKTTFIKRNHKNYRYVNLDNMDYLTLAQKDTKAICDLSNKLIIDEVQRVPKLSIAVKYAIDEQKANIVMSGSSRIGLLDSAADTLAGRIDILSLPPCCWGENNGPPTHKIFEEKSNYLQIKEANRTLKDSLVYGGFPEVITQKTGDEKRNLLRNYRDTYFTRDLSLLSNIENIPGLLAILYHYGISLGSLTRISSFANESGLSHQTAQKYLNVIYQSELGFRLTGYQYGPAKRQIKSSKSFFCDNGLITALNIECSRGQSLENFVISEIEKRRKIGFFKCDELHYYQSKGGSEIDLIIKEGRYIRAVEIKATMKPQKKDISNLKQFIRDDPKHKEGFLFYPGDEYTEIDGIKCLPVAAIYRGK